MPRSELVTPLFWSSLALSLACGATAQALLAALPASFAVHWFRQSAVLVALHLTTLGFVGLLILGVLTQFLPMLLGASLGSAAMAGAGLACFGLGILLLVGVFAGWRSPGAAFAAGLGLLGGALYTFILAWPALVHRGERQRLCRATLASSLFYLVLTAGLGALMAQGLVGGPRVPLDPLALLRLHAHLGLVGFASLMVFAVSYELLPMFNLAKGYSQWPGWLALGLVHAGLAGLAIAVFVPFLSFPALGRLSEAVLALACVAYAAQVGCIQAKAIRPQKDASVWLFRQACVALLASGFCALLLAWKIQAAAGQVAAAVYGVLFGFLGGAILSQLQKIVPLMAWVDRFSRLAGRANVPTAAQLMDRTFAWLALPLHAAALLCGCWGLAVSSPGLLRISGVLGLTLFTDQVLLVWICRTRGKAIPCNAKPAVLSGASL